ncbi:autotransporter outer membrane beta-barrel domain-containing protein [Termitidicoccus mucosus]|uniref:Autotransporter domain-containing protein n=1 Tax=Termitidicoccus mucosus TaxID=1184151 RepID=A0A178IKI3_9BACT|nr:hypothetical protein AW736_10800 [Opitutaceae bacterium TSB47]
MKTVITQILRRAALPGILLALANHSLPLRAQEIIFGTGSTNPATGALVAGGTVRLTGDDATLQLDNGRTLTVSDYVSIGGAFTALGGKDLTFRPFDDLPGQWARLDMTGGARIFSTALPATGTQTLHLDRVILSSGSGSGGGALNATGANANNALIIEGDVVFLNNVSGGVSGAVNANPAMLVFTGTTIFQGNSAGRPANSSDHGGALYYYPNTYSGTLLFQNDVLFLSNTMNGAQGGALSVRYSASSPTTTAKFMRNTTFINNTAYTNGGGAAFYDIRVPVEFAGDVTVAGNQAKNGHSGGMAAPVGTILFSGTHNPGATTVLFSSNTAATNAGGLTAVVVDFTGGLLKFTDNTAVSGNAGGINNTGTLRITGSYAFSNNQAGAAGGAVYSNASGANITLNGSGSFAGNIAGATGGAIHLNGADTFLDIRDGALFTNNAAGGDGGAIYAKTGAKLSLTAATGDIVFRDNKAGAALAGTAGGFVASGGTASAIYFENTGSLDIHADEGRSVVFDDPLTGSATAAVTLRKTGDGILSFGTHASDVTLDTTVEAGVMRLTGGAVYGKSGTGSFTLNAGRLEGNGKIQTKDATLANGVGLTVLDGGALVIEAAGGGMVSAGAGLKLAGTGTLSLVGASQLNAGEITVGALAGPAAGTLTLTNTLALDAGAVLRYDLYTGNQSDRVDAAGVSLLGTGTIRLGTVATGSFTVMTWTDAGLSAGDLASLAVRDANGGELNARNTASLLLSGNSLVLNNVTSSLDMEWTGATGTLTWQSSPAESANWTDSAATNPELYFRNGDSARFGATATGSVTVAPAGVTASGIEVAVTAGTLTFAGGTITTDAASAEAGATLTGTTGKLVKTGAGTLVFSNTANLFKAGIELGGGVLVFNKANQLATGAGAGILFTDGATLRASADITGFATGITIADGKTAAFDTQNHAVGYSGVLALAPAATSGTFVKTGSGALTLSGNNTAYTGALRVNAGSLLLAPGAQLGGAVTVANGAVFGGAGTATGGVSLLGGSVLQVGGTLEIGGALTVANAELVFNGTNTRLDAGSVAASGSNTIDLQGFNPGTYTLGNIGGLMASATVAITIDGNPLIEGSRSSANAFEDAGTLKVNYSAGASLRVTWTGTGASNTVWDTANNNWSSTGDTKFAAGDTVVFTGSGANLALNLVGTTVTVSDLEVGGSAALRFTGVGIVADKDSVREPGVSEITDAKGQLRKSGAGLLTLDNAANQFKGGIVMSGGTLAFSRADQIGTTGTTIAFAASAALASGGSVAMTLDNTITIDAGAVATVAVDAPSLTLAGALGGSGTLAKTGAGMLVYSGTAALGHAATRIDDGLVKLAGIPGAASAGVVHLFDLNGGWLDLSDSPAFDTSGSTANDWAQLTITGEAGRVIGGNDKIVLGNGAIGFGIGHATDVDKQGLFVEVAAGAGVAVMTGSNYYAGYTRILSGTLRVMDDAQLGLAALNREIIFAGAGGAALEIASAAFSSSRAIDLRADGVIGVSDAAGIATWAGVISGSHSLTKTGDGTLVLAGSNDYTGGTVIAGGTLAGSTTSLQGRITNNASLVFDQQAVSSEYSGTVTGGGKVFKSGPGGLVLAGRIEAGEFNIDGGAVTIGGGNPIATTTAFNIGSAGSLRGTGTIGGGATRFLNRGALYVGKAAGQAGPGTLTLHGDYFGENDASLTLAVTWEQGTVIDADKLVISGSASGRTTIKLAGTGAIGQTAAASADELVVAQGGSSEDAFELDQPYMSGIYEMSLRNNGGTWSLVANEIAPDVPAVLGVDASALFIGKASMESLGKRFTATRSLNVPHRFELWLNGLYREDNISDTAYEGTESHTAGVQVGGDWSLALGGAGRLTLGLFYDYARTDMTLPFADSSTETESHGFGGYAAYKVGAWFANGLFRMGREDYTVSMLRTPAFVMEGDSWAASIEAGRVFEVDSRWRVEPQVQLSWQGHSIDDVTDKFGRTFVVDSVSSFDARAGVRLWEEYQWKPGLLITPYARLGAAYEFKGRGRVTVAGTPFENDLSGLNGLFDAGLAMQLGKGLSLHLDGSWYLGRKLDGYSFNLGAAYAW